MPARACSKQRDKEAPPATNPNQEVKCGWELKTTELNGMIQSDSGHKGNAGNAAPKMSKEGVFAEMCPLEAPEECRPLLDPKVDRLAGDAGAFFLSIH